MDINVELVLLTIAILSTTAFIVKVAFPIDSGAEITGDYTSITDLDTSFNLFTFEGICAFFMAAGWMSWFLKAFIYFSTKRSILIGVIIGILALLFYTWLISKIRKLEYVPSANYSELINKTGKAYMKFAPKGQAKIEIEFNSKLEILDATNNSDIEIQSFEAIKVVDVKDNIIYVEKI